MSEGGFVECVTHGTQPRAHVCRHIVETLDSGVSVGFHWSAEDTSSYPDAWCTACDTAVKNAGGEWTEQVLQSVGVSPEVIEEIKQNFQTIENDLLYPERNKGKDGSG